ncbi:unnamed protein product, partial [Prorocentrum cordatum]
PRPRPRLRAQMQRAMVTVRNTFLAVESAEEDDLKLPGGSPFSRSKSVGDEPGDMQEGGSEEGDPRLGHLSRLLRRDPASPGHPVAPLPASPRGAEAGPWGPELAAPLSASGHLT